MGELDDAARDFVDEFATPTVDDRWAIGTVQTVTAGASSDSRALVTVNVNGSTTAAACNYDLTLAAGHVVLVLLLQGYPIIVCRLGSFPPIT